MLLENMKLPILKIKLSSLCLFGFSMFSIFVVNVSTVLTN